ncbi:ATP-grasp domain-containing protein [Azospirillum argentinense]|uniref:ATP-grasp domain-containing protein n=1 Tax=Azospirillum argentinense TaxID=2970906 RepID=UPI001FFE72A4|nr:ATP-grasp domain-containing protein [Azospirillum argentinense]
MPTTPPARSPVESVVERPDILVVALSARALAAAARRAGRRPASIDLFADLDTRQLAEPCLRLPTEGLRLEFGALREPLARAELQGVPLVYGAGFEDDPALLARLAEDRPLMGNRPEVVARVKDPFRFAATLDWLGITHPPVAPAWDGSPGDHLRKRIGGSGGAHITPATDGKANPGWYIQRRIAGHALSVLFLADGDRAVIVGLSRQWTAPTAASPYRYGGAAGPWRCPERWTRTLPAMINRLVAAFELLGLNSTDFLVTGPDFHLLEINPRPGATLDVFDRPPMPPLLGLHLDACTGCLPDRLPTLSGCRAAAVCYADAATRIETGRHWPAWTADRPAAPTIIGRGEPVCTVFGEGPSATAARRHAERRQRELAALTAMEMQ